jgi:hypothetical protein
VKKHLKELEDKDLLLDYEKRLVELGQLETQARYLQHDV